MFDSYLQAVGRPATDDWSPSAGQWRGAVTQVHRWIAGVLHELMIVVQKNKLLVKAAEFQSLVAMLGPEAKKLWTEFFDASLDTKGNTASLLNRIRNNAAFHYGPHDLGDGYKKHFVTDAKDKPSPANKTAQYSYGRDMDGTRFYYADAAVQQKMMMLGLKLGSAEADRTLVELGASANQWLVPLIAAFIYSRTGKLDDAARADPSWCGSIEVRRRT